MKFINRFWICIFLTTSSISFASGTLVGNGAGIVEQNIMFTYDALGSVIDTCLSAPEVCGVSQAEQAELLRIQEISRTQPASPERIRFVSEKERPGFFDTDIGQAHRLAKTGNSPKDVIYWNSDLLYGKDGLPAIDIPAISAIWIHELGHQAKNMDHASLDQLGAKIRLLLGTSSIPLKYADVNSAVSVTAYNYSTYTASSDVYLSDGEQSVALKATMNSVAKCSNAKAELLGWSVVYMRWDSRMIRQIDGTAYLPFTAYIKVHCVQNGILEELDQDVYLYFQFLLNKGKYLYSGTLVSDGRGGN